MKPRFSKTTLIASLEAKMTSLSEQAKALGLKRGFVLGNGWSQVDGRGEELNRLYGAWDFTRNLLDEIR